MVDIGDITTIKLSRDTKKRLDKLKIHKKESYEDTIQKILAILNMLKDNPLRARVKLQKIENLKRKIKEN